MKTIKIAIKGMAPLLMHSSRLVNKRDPIVREMAKITSKPSKKQTDDDLEKLSELEFFGGLWLHENKPMIPTEALEKCFREGCSAARKGKDADRGAWVNGDGVPLTYEGPREPAKLWAERDRYAFIVRACVNNGKKSIMRTRAIFRSWACAFTMSFDPQILSDSAVCEAWIEAGRTRGLGDWRPKYGRFEVAFP